MTVSELIAKLGTFPPGARVVVNGYESGFSDLFDDTVGVGKITLNAHHDWWEGLHGEPGLDDGEIAEAVILARSGADSNRKRLTGADDE